MGRTRPLLQQIIMGVKINLAKWSDALLETSNCVSLILPPPPCSPRAANNAVVGADVSPGEEGVGGLPPRGFEPPSGTRLPLSASLSWDLHASQHPPPPSAAPRPSPLPPSQPCTGGGLREGRRASLLTDFLPALGGSITPNPASPDARTLPRWLVTGDQDAEYPLSAGSTLHVRSHQASALAVCRIPGETEAQRAAVTHTDSEQRKGKCWGSNSHRELRSHTGPHRMERGAGSKRQTQGKW